MGEDSAALRTRSTKPKLPSFTDRLLVVRLEDEANLDPSLVAYLRAQEAAAEAEAATRHLKKVIQQLNTQSALLMLDIPCPHASQPRQGVWFGPLTCMFEVHVYKDRSESPVFAKLSYSQHTHPCSASKQSFPNSVSVSRSCVKFAVQLSGL